MARRTSDPDRKLAETVVAFINLERWPEAGRLFRPWYVKEHPRVLEGISHRLVQHDQKFMREALAALIQDPPAFRARRARDLVLVVQEQLRVPKELRKLARDEILSETDLAFSFRRGEGFTLTVRPTFTRWRGACWYAFALLLDNGRGFMRGLRRCHAPARSEGATCGRFFWRSRTRQHFCSSACSERAEQRANKDRQWRWRHPGESR